MGMLRRNKTSAGVPYGNAGDFVSKQWDAIKNRAGSSPWGGAASFQRCLWAEGVVKELLPVL
jgi:hypothetical protein